MNPSVEDLIKWGADYRPLTVNGEWWRLLTACFLHIGVLHLALNMYALLSIGLLLERLMGPRNFLIAYLLTGISASVTSVWWHENSVGAGASGAIFGVYGIFVAMLTTSLIHKEERQAQLKSILLFIGYNLAFGLTGGVDNAAHIGGLLSGFFLGYGFYYMIKNPQKNAVLLTAVISSVIIYTSVIFSAIADDRAKYFSEMEKFSALEEKGLEFYKLPDNTSTANYLTSLKSGIDQYSKTLPILKEIKTMDLPLEMKQRNQLLEKYVTLRIKTYQLIHNGVKEDTDKYNSEIQSCNKQLEAFLKEIEKLN